ncbi:DUF4403 family protein [Sphingomonas sp. LHG3406-1]|uniref:DUF4403 family protein n=1 Tax=Sphingomonas sp. LHG3406-1 TaxID=2804617 RepID=UPI002604143A|nr:DUF4403 family protein [Sphingomonas sp. LHG3406-1]
MRRTGRLLAFVTLALLAASCRKPEVRPAPVRDTSAVTLPATSSSFTVPIVIRRSLLQQALERSVPRRLWTIDQQERRCVPAQRVRLLGKRLKVTPDIGCRIVGQVMRGSIGLTGQGERLLIRLPVRAQVSARDVGGVLKGETATGTAIVSARVRLGLGADWRPRARVEIDYDWREPPGIDFLGQRIRFVQRADRELAGVIARIERELEREIAKVPIRPLVADAWRSAHMVFELNRENPPAFMRVTPSAFGLQRYELQGNELRLLVGGVALTETFVGKARPEPKPVQPLPPPSSIASGSRLQFNAAVLADYAELEPVVLRALRKLNEEGIALPRIGRIEALFDKVTIYATENGRLAVGIDARARRLDASLKAFDLESKGTIWLTGRPVNAAGETRMRVENLAIFGQTDNRATNLVLSLLNRPETLAAIAEALTQDFQKEQEKVLVAAREAIADRRLGDFRLRATIDKVEHGEIRVTGQGLLLPVSAQGTARMVLAR